MLIDEYSGLKELYEVVVKATTPITINGRQFEVGEPVMFFERVNMSLLTQTASPISARGGWDNLPRVVWENRSDVSFHIDEGVVSNMSLNFLLSASTDKHEKDSTFYVHKVDGPQTPVPIEIDDEHTIYILDLSHRPYINIPTHKVFIYRYDNDVLQQKYYGKYYEDSTRKNFDGSEIVSVQLFRDSALQNPVIDDDSDDWLSPYVVDYYYSYGEGTAIVYTVNKERFNGVFSLEGKFYSKDENRGINRTNLIYMPRMRIVSDINLRLGERADPTMASFHIIGMPQSTTTYKNMVLEITTLDKDIDDE